MNWQAYRVVLALRTSLHAGYRKVGNLQQTRPYLPGRMLWGALTERLTRMDAGNTAPQAKAYRDMGNRVNERLAFSYFYPTSDRDADPFQFPWDCDMSEFVYRFISSYGSTAIAGARTGAEEASLHEVEFISPNTRASRTQDSKPVFLVGYILERTDVECLDWRIALEDIQIGGERGYGWGRLHLVHLSASTNLFGHCVTERDGLPAVHLADSALPLLAHAGIAEVPEGIAAGRIEPLVGRAWGTNKRNWTGFGQKIEKYGLAWPPGTRVTTPTTWLIREFGLWEYANA